MYLEMCEAMGTEPLEEDMPIEFGDLYYEFRQALNAYHMLPSIWTGTGYYAGKDYTGTQAVFDLLNIRNNRGDIMGFLFIIDKEVSEDIARKQKAKGK